MKCRRCGIKTDDDIQDGLCPSCQLLDALPDKLATRKQLGGVPFSDMQHLDEVERFKQIVKTLATNPGRRVLVIVDRGGRHQGKGDRYIKGITHLFPEVKLVDRKPGPGIDSESLYFQYKLRYRRLNQVRTEPNKLMREPTISASRSSIYSALRLRHICPSDSIA